MGESNFNLPPGFQFCPTEEELVLHFLYHKASLLPCQPNLIPELPFLHNPWDYTGKAFSNGNVFYFFRRMTESKETESGYWKNLNIDEPMVASDGNKVGRKKYFVFYIVEAQEDIETNWVMEEFHICSYLLKNKPGKGKKDFGSWVLCRVYEGKGSSEKSFCYEDNNQTELSCLDEMFLSLDDDLDEISFPS